MPNAAKVNFNVTNLTQTIETPLQGLTYVMGRSLAGPFADPKDIINSWPQFVSVFGGLSSDTDAPLLVKRMLEKGASIRFNRVGHYTDISDASTLDAEKAKQPTTTILIFDEVLIEDNSVSLEINTDEIGPVVFEADHDTTIQNLVDAITAHPAVLSATPVIIGDNYLQVLITPNDGEEVAVTNFAVTGGVSQTATSIDQVTNIVNTEGEELFELVPKYEGASFNKFVVIITSGSNGQPGYFDIYLTHTEDPTVNESYQNLIIKGSPTANDSTYLSSIVQSSRYIDVVYKDLSAITGSKVPMNMSFRFAEGSDGSTPTEGDYIGDSNSRTGFHAFDEYNDSMQILALDTNADEVHIAGSAYAHNRKDLIYLLELEPTPMSKTAIMAKRQSLNIDSRFTYIYGGGIKLKNPLTGLIGNYKAAADLVANIVRTDQDFGEWYSFAGHNRGNITGALGVINNFGSPANFKDLNDLAQRQINMVINRDNSIKLWGNFSAQVEPSQESQISIVRLIIFLQKSLRPTLERFLEEPNDIPTWKRIFFTVKPFLDGLVTSRALFTYEWQGDQNASSLNNLQVNNAADVTQGKYKVNLMIKAIPSVQEINVNIILTPAGIEFETVSELT